MNEVKAGTIEWGVVLKALAGYEESGDQYWVKNVPTGTVIAAIDGLGHGDKAAHAAKLAVSELDSHPQEVLTYQFKRCHKRLGGTRGVVMSMASFNLTAHTLTWLGVGNVHGVLFQQNGVGPAQHAALLLRGGTLGYRIPTLRPETRPLAAGDTLIFVSDGVRSGFSATVDLALTPQALADDIFQRYTRGTDDTLVLVARYTQPRQ